MPFVSRSTSAHSLRFRPALHPERIRCQTSKKKKINKKVRVRAGIRLGRRQKPSQRSETRTRQRDETQETLKTGLLGHVSAGRDTKTRQRQHTHTQSQLAAVASSLSRQESTCPLIVSMPEHTALLLYYLSLGFLHLHLFSFLSFFYSQRDLLSCFLSDGSVSINPVPNHLSMKHHTFKK